MNDFPDTRAMLPSEARAAIQAFFLARFRASTLDMYGLPCYDYADALGDMPKDVDGYAWVVLSECFDAAYREYTASRTAVLEITP